MFDWISYKLICVNYTLTRDMVRINSAKTITTTTTTTTAAATTTTTAAAAAATAATFRYNDKGYVI